MTNPIPICYITDANYLLPTVVSIESLIFNRNRETQYKVHLITSFTPSDSEQSAIEHLNSLCSRVDVIHIESHAVEKRYVSKVKNHVSNTALLKYEIPNLIPEYDKVLYIDCDTIIQHDVSTIYNTNLGENYIGAALALIGFRESYHMRHYNQTLGVPFSQYINTGVILMNTAAFRRDAVDEKLFSFSEEHKHLIFMDQDAFNVICKDRVLVFPQTYNLMPECDLAPAQHPMNIARRHPEKAIILHFAGKVKPWLSPRAPLADFYQPYFKRSYYRDARKRLDEQKRNFLLRSFESIISKLAGSARRLLQSVSSGQTRKINREVIRNLDAFTRQNLLESLVLTGSQTSGIYSGPARKQRIVLSLTTIPSRLYELRTTIESLFRQTWQADEIVLWLDRESLTDAEIPIELQNMRSRGLTIKFVEDVGPHTKLWHALKQYPQDLIITVDDDVLYSFSLVERLVKAYQSDPGTIHCARARHISNLKGPDFSYINDWKNLETEVKGFNILPLGVGGVLYPPQSLDDTVFDLELMKSLTPKADDIWFKTMSLLKRTPCHVIDMQKSFDPLRPFSQQISLHTSNLAGGNEEQVNACFKHFNVWDMLREEQESL